MSGVTYPVPRTDYPGPGPSHVQIATADLPPSPLVTTRISAFDLPLKQMQPYAKLDTLDNIPYPLWLKITAHDPIQKVMQPDAILGRTDNAPYPLYLKITANDPTQKSMQPYAVVAPSPPPPPAVLYPLIVQAIQAFSYSGPISNPISIQAYTPVAPVTVDPLITRVVEAFDLAQKQAKPYSLLAYADAVVTITVDPLLTRRIAAFDYVQRTLQSISLQAYADSGPISLKSAAFDLPQKFMQSFSILASKDFAPDPLLSRVTKAFSLVDKAMQPDSILINPDLIPYPLLTRTIAAFSLTQKSMQPDSIVGSVDAAPYPLLQRATAFDLTQKIMQPYSLLARADPIAPIGVMYTTYVKAHDPVQKLMAALSILNFDRAPDPLVGRRIQAFDYLQKIGALSIFASRDAAPDPLLARYIRAFDLPQKLPQTLSILAAIDRFPYPLAYKATAVDLLQKQMQPYSFAGYAPPIIYTVDPLVTRRIIASDLPQKQTLSNSVLGQITRAPDPLFARRIAAFEYAQKMQPESILASRDFAPDPLLRYVVAHTTFQRVAPYPRFVVADRIPYPLLTRFVHAHDPVQKQMLPESILLPVFIPTEFHVLAGILIGRMWDGNVGRMWDGRHWRRWKR